MNLEKCTDQQRTAITTLDAPLMVSAGAGSGKTFTLTQRVVYALAPTDSAAPFLHSVDELLAITFTTKAAAELKSRIKGLLLDEGLDGEALKVDDAWISTIHGMASRILREHALEVGIDPAFEVVADAEAERLLDEALEQVVVRARGGEDECVTELLRTEKLRGTSFNDKGVVEYAREILDRAHAMPRGLAALDCRGAVTSPAAIVRRVAEAAADLLAAGRAWDDKPPKTTLAFLDELEGALDQAYSWLLEVPSSGFDAEAFDAEGFCRVLYSFPAGPGSRVRDGYAEAFESWWTVLNEMEGEARAGLALRWQEAIVRVARQVDEAYAAMKGPARLDNTDLLVRCAQALREHPSIAESLRDKFKLIMVDEFQDTDRLQVDVIGRIAHPGFANVCTVGDAQQSIYRFRGADVNVFFEYRDNLCASSPRDPLVEMGDNFRSHGDVLAFVERIFGDQEVFGDDFLKLAASGVVNGAPDALFESRPRIQVDVTHHGTGAGQVGRGEARDESARAIADHFAQLSAEGAKAADMVVLLGSMSHADVYARALREAGLASMIAGGSVFARMEESKLVSMLLHLAVNHNDDEALYATIASRLFALSDDVLLVLATRRDEAGEPHRRSLSAGLYGAALADELAAAGLSGEAVRSTLLCRDQLGAFATDVRVRGVAAALRRLLVRTGLLDRLQAEGVAGMASAANFAKALRLVDRFEKERPGVAGAAEAFDAHLAIAKEAPGALAAEGGDFVRIMTIHASKGLEFPHVAVAELKDGKEGQSRLVVENIGGETYLSASFMPYPAFKDRSDKIRKLANKLEERSVIDISDLQAEERRDVLATLGAGARYASLARYAQDQALYEARRLLYVALTRASKSLFVSLLSSSKPENAYEGEGTYEDIFRAVPWDLGSDRSVTVADYGGSAPARIAFRMLAPESDTASDAHLQMEAVSTSVWDSREDDEEVGASGSRAKGSGNLLGLRAGDDDENGRFLVPERVFLAEPVLVPHGFAHDGLHSYSSISGTHAHSDESVTDEEIPGASYVWESASEVDASTSAFSAGVAGPLTAESATALGTAFHRLAQQAIERSEHGALFCPEEGAVRAQIRKEGLSIGQQERLRFALTRWFGSDEAARFASFEHRRAEVPFVVEVPARDAVPNGGDGMGNLSSGSFFLEGEIDGLADNGDGAAFLIDYKTGGRDDETPEQLDEKHRLQASCYAYALMRAGYESVDAHFLRIEHAGADNPRDPQIVPYHFDKADLPALEALIIAKQKEATL